MSTYILQAPCFCKQMQILTEKYGITVIIPLIGNLDVNLKYGYLLNLSCEEFYLHPVPFQSCHHCAKEELACHFLFPLEIYCVMWTSPHVIIITYNVNIKIVIKYMLQTRTQLYRSAVPDIKEIFDDLPLGKVYLCLLL